MSLFLPEFDWFSIEKGRELLYNEAPADEVLPHTMRQLESLIGYTFTKKSLLVEAMTHPSCTGPGIRASLDRLEFLGDAILDYVVVTALYGITSPAPLPNSTLHLLRTALVNADILAFLVMEWTTTQTTTDITITTNPSPNTTTTNAATEVHLTSRPVPVPLSSFLRHASPELAALQHATALRHARLRPALLGALRRGASYPWTLLGRLQAQKVYSDVFESVLGAVWVDSGSLAACEAVVERAGVLALMRRLVDGRVWCLHPKEELGRLAGGRRVEYTVEVGGEEEEAGERVFGCRVAVGGAVVGESEGALSREEARTRAAEAACEALRKGKVREGWGDRGDKGVGVL